MARTNNQPNPSDRNTGFVFRKVTATIKGVTPLSQSRALQTARGENEPADAHDLRCWKERMHVNPDGLVFIPPLAIKNGLTDAAAKLGLTVPGHGRKQYKGLFESGIMCSDPIILKDENGKPIKADDVVFEKLHVPADGRRGGSTRVFRHFPYFPKWQATVEFIVLDERIGDAAIERHMRALGVFVGLGRFRPSRNGYYGRFSVLDIKIEATSE